MFAKIFNDEKCGQILVLKNNSNNELGISIIFERENAMIHSVMGVVDEEAIDTIFNSITEEKAIAFVTRCIDKLLLDEIGV
jgi:hypothetical protein